MSDKKLAEVGSLHVERRRRALSVQRQLIRTIGNIRQRFGDDVTGYALVVTHRESFTEVISQGGDIVVLAAGVSCLQDTVIRQMKGEDE